MKGHQLGVVSVSASADGRSLATTALDSKIRVWDLGNLGEAPSRVIDAGPVEAWTVEYVDEGTLATGSQTGAVNLWNIESGEKTGAMETAGTFVMALALHPNGKQMAAAGHDGRSTVSVVCVDAVVGARVPRRRDLFFVPLGYLQK
jgi:WD repeat-containing protein 61